MWKTIALAGMLAFTVGSAAAARIADVPTGTKELRLYGLPIFTSDGVEIGVVSDTGTDEDDRLVLLAEITMPLGIGAQTVAIPLDLIEVKSDRVDLSLTAAQVRETISRAQRDVSA